MPAPSQIRIPNQFSEGQQLSATGDMNVIRAALQALTNITSTDINATVNNQGVNLKIADIEKAWRFALPVIVRNVGDYDIGQFEPAKIVATFYDDDPSELNRNNQIATGIVLDVRRPQAGDSCGDIVVVAQRIAGNDGYGSYRGGVAWHTGIMPCLLTNTTSLPLMEYADIDVTNMGGVTIPPYALNIIPTGAARVLYAPSGLGVDQKLGIIQLGGGGGGSRQEIKFAQLKDDDTENWGEISAGVVTHPDPEHSHGYGTGGLMRECDAFGDDTNFPTDDLAVGTLNALSFPVFPERIYAIVSNPAKRDGDDPDWILLPSPNEVVKAKVMVTVTNTDTFEARLTDGVTDVPNYSTDYIDIKTAHIIGYKADDELIVVRDNETGGWVVADTPNIHKFELQNSNPSEWAAETLYSIGDIVQSSAGGIYEVTERDNDYISGLTEPTWDTTVGNETDDGPPIWEADTVYAAGAFIQSGGNMFEVTARTDPFESGSVEPTWDTTEGNTTTDNDLTWTCRGTVSPSLVWTRLATAPASEAVAYQSVKYYRDGSAFGDAFNATLPEAVVNASGDVITLLWTGDGWNRFAHTISACANNNLITNVS